MRIDRNVIAFDGRGSARAARARFVGAAAALLALAIGLPAAHAGTSAEANAFVERSGTRLVLGGEPFRYSGPNVEWLGLVGYGPKGPVGPHYPTSFEVDDAFATAKEMGALVVRSQTLGDTMGCADCLEPTLGAFNAEAFRHLDYAIKSAHDHGMKLIITLIGDCVACGPLGGMSQYLAWHDKHEAIDFFTDPQIVADFERRIGVILNHVNSLTGVAYKDDPTIMAWENCNMCESQIQLTSNGKAPDLAAMSAWVGEIGRYLKSVDHRHLYLDTTGVYRSYPAVLDRPESDLVTYELYPHWNAFMGLTTAATFSTDATTVTGRGKVFIVNEYGWDTTNWPTQGDLKAVLDTIEQDKDISGDGYWAMLAHDPDHGWQAVPFDTADPKVARYGESGQWWALYYTGVKSLVNSAEDMRERGQMLRAHAYAMRGMATPPHALPPAPAITAVKSGAVTWRGSAGAANYTIQRRAPGGRWKTVCNRCVTDADAPWSDPAPPKTKASYRVIPFNLDGKPGTPSQATAG